MTIYDLLKNSSPSMAKHFNESEEGVKKNTEDISKLETRVTTLENGSSGGSGGAIVHYEKILDSNVQFEQVTRVIDNVSHTAYSLHIDIDTTKDKFPYNPSFHPRCPVFSHYTDSDTTSYTEIPMLDYDNNEIFKHQNYTGFALSRQYNGEGLLKALDLLITQETYHSIIRTVGDDPIRYKLYA